MTIAHFTVAFFRSAVLFALWTGFAHAQQTHPHWSYRGPEGPSAWGKLDSTYTPCDTGKMESPIDIRGAKEVDLPMLRFNYQSVPLTLIDNGHTIQVNYPAGSTLTVGEKTYTLKQFHFHHPSEEHVNGHRYDMVAHLVHSDEGGHVAVVAIFLKKGENNAVIDSVWKNIPSKKEEEKHVSGVSISLKDLLPAEHGYYTFAGSLTTPPCSEGVTWFVLKNPVTISETQIAAFARIYPMNARPIQPLNGRQILETK